MNNRKIIGILLICLALMSSSISCTSNGGTGEVSQQLREVVKGDFVVTISGSGSLEVTTERNLTFGSGGKVTKIYIREGDEVKKDDVLAELDTSVLELALNQAQVARDEASYNLSQLRDVIHASTDRIIIAEALLELAERSVTEAQKQLTEAIITAPFDGTVARVDAKEGDIVSSPAMALQPVIRLIDLASMELVAEVDEIDIAEVKTEQKAIIEVDALPALELEGRVTSISQLPSPQAGVVLYEVKISLDANEGLGLRVGMSATADIIISERKNVLLVSSRAVQQDSHGQTIVEVMVNEQIEERVVVTGISDGIQTEIVKGLSEGEIAVIRTRSS
ncbi:efflux RND transporter periplasmic adaptor subunit [Chloroflexota bacterium]